MNVMAKMLKELQFRIPIEVLRQAFKDDIVDWNRAPISLQEQIMSKVIRPRVLVDIDLYGGTEAIVSLDGINPEWIDDNYSQIYTIPPERLDNKNIVSILSVSYIPYYTSYNALSIGTGSVNPLSLSDIATATQRLSDSYSNIPILSNARCDLLGPRTVIIRDQMKITGAYQLRCILGYDEALNGIKPRSIDNFCRLCELAVKSYIYNKLLVRMDRGQLIGGMDLGAFKSYVDGLSDAEEMYRTYLKEIWAKVALMNDQPRFTRFIKSMFPASI